MLAIGGRANEPKGPNDESEPLTRAGKWKLSAVAGLLIAPLVVSGCTTTGSSSKASGSKTAAASHVKSVNGVKTYTYTTKDRTCLERAMFFESNRSSPDGLIAVGTVVMNRLASGSYPDTICGVVGQKNQFAPGVLSRKMDSKKLPDVQAAADAVLKGKRHPRLKNAMFFHTAGLKFPYRNMHYVLVAGGNSFYEKRNRDGTLQNPVPDTPYNLAMAYTPQSSSLPDTPSYDVTQPLAGSADAAPTVQVAMAEAAKTSDQNTQLGFGPQARGNRVARHRGVPIPQEAKQPTQLAAYQSTPSQIDNASAQTGTQLGFSAPQGKVDEIGAMLLKQDRPEPAM